uniref:Uncharacterized protein n=1 Tax=viral metagenome TaxID=1070528 RepID=A0A6C0J2T3_9ZZZZ
MFCKHCYCYCDKLVKYKNANICTFCHSIYIAKCDTCGLDCNDTCLELFSKVLKIE